MKQLYLITDGFPYGKGEKTFITSELKKMLKKYSVCVISTAEDEIYRDKEHETILDSEVDVVRWNRDIKSFKFILFLILFWFKKACILEVKDIISSKDKVVVRIWKSMQYYARAEMFYAWTKRNNIIQNTEGICYSYWYKDYLLGILLHRNKFSKLKIITRTHGYDLYDERVAKSMRQPFRKYMDGELDKVIFASNYGCSYYVNKMRNSMTEKYTVQKIGVPNAKKNIIQAMPNTKFHMVSCSNVIPLKRVCFIIEALSKIENMNISWTHIGTGSEYEKILKCAQEQLGKKKNITYDFLGYICRDDIYSFYANNEISCFITLSESEGGCPVSIQEAMAYGIPIIGTSVGGITEMIKENGLLLSRNPSIDEIINAIATLYYMEDEKYQNMREKSFALWEQEYNSKKNVEKFMELLNSL